MTNRLSNENSPYLLQHADNPVEWYPWGEEALERARQEDRPIFLSIGYAACHWCHVMAHESFEDPGTAGFMNANFINIKVDREERPDLDSIYMNAVVAMTGQGGWPMSVFLTPGGQPFYGGTYFPPTRRYGMPSFREVLQGVKDAWEKDRENVRQSSQEISAHLRSVVSASLSSQPLSKEALERACLNLAQAYDWTGGGWGQAPKFPQAMAIDFLLRRAATDDRMALDISVHALSSMARGGMYDVVGGGFARYSTDNGWLVPHFEKMLYDNGLLAQAYLHAYLLTGEARFRQVCEETLDFIARELYHPLGGFFSSLDADSEGQEGKYYLWTAQEIRQVLPEAQEAEFLLAAYHVTETGNFEGKNILQRALDDRELSERFNLPVEAVPGRLKDLHARLLAAREHRVRPATDDKVLVSWNALALVAFAEAARYLDRPDYLEVATRNARFLLEYMYVSGRLLRSWRKDQAQHNAYLEDYSGLILGLLSLYQSDPDPAWYRYAQGLAEDMLAHFRDPAGGFFDTRDDHGSLVIRPKDLEDNATPSGNSLAALALLQLSAYTGQGNWRDLAENMLSQILSQALRYPTGFGLWLCAIDFALAPVLELALIGSQTEPGLLDLVRVTWETFRPHLVAARSAFPPAADDPPLLAGRTLVDGKPAAYVCQAFVCQRPVTSTEELRELLGQPASISKQTGQ